MDIFISYRRDTGSREAALLNEKLKVRGVRPFLDKHRIHSEDFFNSIVRHIDASPNFLMVLTPGYFVNRGEDDWVRKEIEHAVSQKKRIIAVYFEGYNHNEVDWDKETGVFTRFKTYNALPYEDSSAKIEEASIDSILDNMVDAKGRKFSTNKHLENNAWYQEHEMTDEDMLWIISDHDVCKTLDWKLLDRALGESVFGDRKELSLFVYKAYDIDTYRDKYSLGPKRKNDRSIQDVYGFTYDFFVDRANECFGDDHFLPDVFSESGSFKEGLRAEGDAIRKLLKRHGLPGFDLIDFTLTIKDRENPEKVVSYMTQYLNPRGGIIYIRELDDDFIQAYPDEKNLISNMVKLLTLDVGAGNRHTGKKIFTYLKKAGADKVHISNEVISTANLGKVSARERICDTYFSYLLPEMRALASEHPEMDEYKEAYDWLKTHYREVQSLFRSAEFYFRTGHIAGYGVFIQQDEDDDDD